MRQLLRRLIALAGLAMSLALCLVAAPAWAHKPSDSYLTLRADADGRVHVRWDIALRDLDYVLQLDRDGNAELSWGEVRQRGADIARLATTQLTLSAGKQECAWSAAPEAPMALDRHSDGTYAVVSLTAACPALDDGLTVRYTLFADVDPTHRGLVQWLAPGSAQAQALVFGVDNPQQALRLGAHGPWDTLRQYIVEGAWHIWIGFDHILFLLSLLLPAVLLFGNGQWRSAPRFKPSVLDVAKVVTAFTLAHSITLSLAALQVVTLPSRLVESVIAASVVVAALNNLRGGETRQRWLMAFVFGLVHGFGFASVLADLGLPQGALVLALVGFNVGVELGQLAIVAVFLPLAFALRGTAFYRHGVLSGGSLAIASIAAWWFVQRAFDL
ncbi:MAG TPA: HupE/UreJ family protein [Ramlibacter sp.]|nr:HupE/UreJ family protein [Ramlibacter sp.]